MPAVDFVEMILETVQGNENVAPTLATKKLYLPARSARLSPAPGHLDRSDELRSIQGAPPRLIESFAPGGAISERAYYKDLTWLLELAGFVGTGIVGDGATIKDPDNATIPATAYRWTFVKRDSIAAQTAQVKINHKDENVLLTGRGMGVSSLSLNAAGDLSADLAGNHVGRAAADAATVPAYASTAIPPVRRGELYLNWLAGGGKPTDFSLAVANPLERVYDLSLAVPSAFPSSLEHGDDQVYLTGSIPKRSLNATDYDALLGATTFAATARWKSSKSILATAYKYALWIEMPACQYVGGDADDIGNKRHIGASYDFFAAYDETAGYDVKITLVNDVSSIYA
jgi:hypothetical protein